MPIGSTFQNYPELNIGAVFSVGAEAADVINVSVQLIDKDNGNELAERIGFAFYLASNSTGDTKASAPNGGIAIGTDGVMIEWETNVSGLLISENDGDVDIDLTSTAAGTWYLVVVMPDGQLYVSPAITFNASVGS